MKKILLSNIQEFSLHDGPGIRTTVFLKGCPLRCPWCSNPENINGAVQWIYSKKHCIGEKDKCTLTNFCSCQKAKEKAGKNVDSAEADFCAVGALEKIGRYYDSHELFDELIKSQPFWGEAGGVTFSGGEPLAQMEQCKELLELLQANQVNLVAETSLFASSRNVQEAIKYIDLFYVDFKIMETTQCRRILGGDIELFFDNLKLLKDGDKHYVARMPIVPGYTDEQENVEKCIELMSNFMPHKIELFSVHNFGAEKYKRLDKAFQEYLPIPYERLAYIKEYIEKKLPLKAEILKL